MRSKSRSSELGIKRSFVVLLKGLCVLLGVSREDGSQRVRGRSVRSGHSFKKWFKKFSREQKKKSEKCLCN